MADIQKMLRTVINGQSSMKQELLAEIKKVDSKVEGVNKEMKRGFKDVNNRIDKLGSQLAYLEDDAPTREEHEKLEKRVGKLEQKVASA
jgi:predicted nuclease with TOPRIM domain